VKTWRIGADDPARLLALGKLARAVEYSPDGRTLACASHDGTVRLVDLRARTETVLGRHSDTAQAVAFRPDGLRLASCSPADEVRLWEVGSGRCITTFSSDGDAAISVGFSPDGERIAIGGKTRVLVRDAESGEKLLDLPVPSWVWKVIYAPDGRRIAATCADGRLFVWDAGTGAPVLATRTTASELADAAFTADGEMLVTGGGSEVQLWDARAWRLKATHRLPAVYIQGVAPSPDGSRIAVAASGRVLLIETETGRATLELREHKTLVWGIAFHPDGDEFATAAGGYEGQGCEIRLWRAG
jgi:WD40 repeat protein